MVKWTIFFVLIMTLLNIGDTLKILVIFPMPGRSHAILGDGVVNHLLAAGHEITYITAVPIKNPPPKLHQVDVSDNFEKVKGGGDIMNIKTIMESKIDFNNPAIALLFLGKIHTDTLENENVQKLLNDSTQQFDLIFAEWMYSDIYAGLTAIYDCPLIWFSSMPPHWMILSLIDEHPNPSYTPDCISLNLPPFTMYQRFRELFVLVLGTAVRDFYIESKGSTSYQKLIVPAIEKRGKKAPEFHVLKYNASMILGNGHVSLEVPIKLPQNYKEVGGYHIDKDVKPLPQDLQKLLDSAKNGVIYFSMGSNLKSKDMPDAMKKNLLKLFGTLKETVLWKFEENLPDLPKNVHIINWAPQQSILSHPNVRVFITHGGFLSTNEAVHFGVPIIGLPVFGDQFINIDRAVLQGFAIKVELSIDIDVPLKVAIDTMLTDPKYKQKVKELSSLYHDRPIPPGKELVYWVEYVVRTRGAIHLRSPALYTPFYQRMYLDLVAYTLIFLYIIKFLIKAYILGGKVDKKVKTQ